MALQHVLFVDDHQGVRSIAQRALEQEGYAVAVAGDGVEAMESIQRILPDVIVSDIMMPRMDGYALYERVRSHPELVAVPFIFLTAKSEREDILLAKALGVEDYLTKPFDCEELLVAVRSRLARARAISESSEAQLAKLKHEIISVLSHELRTPLCHITGYAELAIDQVAALSTDEMLGLLGAVHDGGKRLVHIVEDLLALVRADSGVARDEYRSLARVRSDLAAIIEQTVDHYRARAAAAGIEIQIVIEGALPAAEICEPFFVDALGRLLDNALGFSGDAKLVVVGARDMGSRIKIAVQDFGVGIPSAEMVHLFERFHQSERHSQEQQGLGLGLAIAQEYANLHGGHITARSEPGAGSTFTIWLPAVGLHRAPG